MISWSELQRIVVEASARDTPEYWWDSTTTPQKSREVLGQTHLKPPLVGSSLR
jgi:hypothetical protein